MDCIFCNIAKNKVETKIILETDSLIVFPDENPHAKVHLLIVPKEHYQDITNTPDGIWNEIKATIVELKKKYSANGFRIVNNYGTSAMIAHMHVHFLSDLDKEEII